MAKVSGGVYMLADPTLDCAAPRYSRSRPPWFDMHMAVALSLGFTCRVHVVLHIVFLIFASDVAELKNSGMLVMTGKDHADLVEAAQKTLVIAHGTKATACILGLLSQKISNADRKVALKAELSELRSTGAREENVLPAPLLKKVQDALKSWD